MRYARLLTITLLVLVALAFAFAALPTRGMSGLQDIFMRPAQAPRLQQCELPRSSGSSHTGGGGGLMIPVTLDGMTAESDLVLLGTVQQLQSCLTEGGSSIVTLVSIAPQQLLKGSDAAAAPDGWVTLTVPGGDFGEYRLNVGTSPEFAVGERAVVFLRQAPSLGIVPTEGFQSKLSVTPEGTVTGLDLSLELLTEKISLATRGDLLPAQDPLNDGLVLVESPYVTLPAKWSTDDIPIPIWINADTGRPSQITAQQTRLAVANAFHTWQNLPNSFIAFGPIRKTSRVSGADGCSSSNLPDGLTDITWGLASNPSHSAGVLATTFNCWKIPAMLLVDADMEIDTDHVGPDWRVDGSGACGSGRFDLETVLLHEFGHVLGLDHPPAINSCTPGTNGGCPVMNATNDGVQRSPCTDDINGVNTLYPLGGGSPPPAPVGLTATPSSSIDLDWNNVADEMGFEIWRAVGACAAVSPADFVLLDTVDNDVLFYTDTNYGGGLSTGQAYCYKVRSFNTNGESAFSNAAEATEGAGPPTATPGATSTPSPPTPTPSPTPTTTPSVMKGDNDCDGDVDAVDALKALRYVAGLSVSQSQPCPNIGSEAASIFGDVDCDGDVDAVDALKSLRYIAGLPNSLPPGCPPIGAPATPTPTPSPTPSPTPAPTGQAFNFTWYVSATEPGAGLCDLSKPVPPNSPADTGLCVAFRLKGFVEQHTIRLKLYVNTILVADFSRTLHPATGPWKASWTPPIPGGEYLLEVLVDDVLIGTSTVEVPGASTPTAPTGQASDFQWYVNSPIVSPFSTCDLSKPVPPNSPAETGLCVRFYLEDFVGWHSIRFLLYRDGVLVSDSSQALSLSVSYWHKGFSATLPGTYLLEVYVDDVLVGTSTVEAP